MMESCNISFKIGEKARCIVCGKEMEPPEMARTGIMAGYRDENGDIVPICVCGSVRCLGTIGILNNIAGAKMNRKTGITFSVIDRGNAVEVRIGPESVVLDGPKFIEMMKGMTTQIAPQLNVVKQIESRVMQVPQQQTEDVIDKCPCCGGGNLWRFEDPGACVIQCDDCKRFGRGNTMADAVADLASKKEVGM